MLTISNPSLEMIVLNKKALLHLPYSKENSGRTHVLVRCPICGDSHKSITHTHCYVNLEFNKPITYYCFLCNNGGYLNSTLLRTLGVSNSKVITALSLYNKAFLKKLKKGNGGYKKLPSGIIDLSAKSYVPSFDKTSNNLMKLEYINKRLGTGLTIEDTNELKIVLSLREFVEKNGLDVNPSMYNRARLIEDNYVGVLSLRGEYITFRNTKNDGNYRYIIYPVFRYNENSNKMYVIPNNDIDIMSNEIELNLTEGYFDILSFYLNLNNRQKKNTICGAVCGSGFLNMVMHINRIGFIGNLNLNIYSDSTMTPSYYRNIFEKRNLFNNIDIYYNDYKGEKDIGVPKERISLRKVKMR